MLARLLWHTLVQRFRQPISALGPSRSSFRIMPGHLDVLLHANNAAYFKLMDAARVDLLGRAGLIPKLRARRWYPVVAAQTIRYRRSLKLFDRFEIVTRVVDCDEQALVMEQLFVRRGEVVAHALVRIRCLAASGPVPMGDVMALAGNAVIPTPVPDYATRWSAEQAAWRTPEPQLP